MAKPTVFLLLGIKLNDVAAAFDHVEAIDARQNGIRDLHPTLYSSQEHAELVAVNLQAIYTKLEGVLADLVKEIDGDLPRTERWHKDLLTIAAHPNDPRPALVSREAFGLLTELLGFRHVVRSRYASQLRIADVFENLKRARRLRPLIVDDLARFERAFGGSSGTSA